MIRDTLISLEQVLQKHVPAIKRQLQTVYSKGEFDYLGSQFKFNYRTQPKRDDYDITTCVAAVIEKSPRLIDYTYFSFISYSDAISRFVRTDDQSLFISDLPVVKVSFFNDGERMNAKNNCTLDYLDLIFDIDLKSISNYSFMRSYIEKDINIFDREGNLFKDQCEPLQYKNYDTSLSQRLELLYIPPSDVCNEKSINECTVVKFDRYFVTCQCKGLRTNSKSLPLAEQQKSIVDKTGLFFYKCFTSVDFMDVLPSWQIWIYVSHVLLLIACFIFLTIRVSSIFESIPHKDIAIYNDCWNFENVDQIRNQLPSVKVEIERNERIQSNENEHNDDIIEEVEIPDIENLRAFNEEFDKIQTTMAHKITDQVVKFNPYTSKSDNFGTDRQINEPPKEAENKSDDFPFHLTPTSMDFRLLSQSSLAKYDFRGFFTIFSEYFFKLNTFGRAFFYLSLSKPVSFRLAVFFMEIYLIIIFTCISFTEILLEKRLIEEANVVF